MKRVTKERAILCTQILENSSVKNFPIAQFMGDVKNIRGKNYGTFWKPNMNCFKAMAKAAGFSRVEEICTFMIEPNYKTGKTLEGVIHCYV